MSDWEFPTTVDEEPVLKGLPQAEPAVFENSSARLVVPSELPLDRLAILAAFLSFLAASAGFYVGIDYLDGTSGMYTHRELIYAQSYGAPSESAILDGILKDQDGNPLANYSFEAHLIDRQNVYATTSEDGSFRLTPLDPGQVIIDIGSPDGDMYTNLVLLNAPAAFEPIGFTRIVFEWPSESDFENGSELTTGRHWIDISESQRENGTQLYDETAAALYDMFGAGFIGLSLITILLAAIGIRTKSTGLIRIATITGFFSMGHFYVSCCLGLFGFLVTLSLIKRE